MRESEVRMVPSTRTEDYALRSRQSQRGGTPDRGTRIRRHHESCQDDPGSGSASGAKTAWATKTSDGTTLTESTSAKGLQSATVWLTSSNHPSSRIALTPLTVLRSHFRTTFDDHSHSPPGIHVARIGLLGIRREALTS